MFQLKKRFHAEETAAQRKGTAISKLCLEVFQEFSMAGMWMVIGEMQKGWLQVKPDGE